MTGVEGGSSECLYPGRLFVVFCWHLIFWWMLLNVMLGEAD